jgi:hypothetical protein
MNKNRGKKGMKGVQGGSQRRREGTLDTCKVNEKEGDG